MPNLVELLKNNRHRELPQKVFEVGQVVKEHSNRTSLSWLELASKATFSSAKATAEIISQRLELDGEIVDEEDSIFIPGRYVQIKSEDFNLRYGEIHPRTLEKFEIGYPAIGGEIVW